MSDAIRLNVTMECVPLFNVLPGEWWFHDGKLHIRGSEDPSPMPKPDTKVYVQTPRGSKALLAKETPDAP